MSKFLWFHIHEWSLTKYENSRHYCGWDYCRCYWAKCTECGKTKFVDNGIDEVR